MWDGVTLLCHVHVPALLITVPLPYPRNMESEMWPGRCNICRQPQTFSPVNGSWLALGFTRTPAPPRSELPPSHFTPSFHLRAVTQYWKTGKADDQGQGTNKLSLSTGIRSHYPRMLAIRKMTTDSIQRTRSRLQRLLCTGIVPGAGTQRQTQSLPASQETE